MIVHGYDIVMEIDGVESVVQLDDTYPSVEDWKTATEFAMRLAQVMHPDANMIDFVQCEEYEMEEYAEYDYIYETPCTLQ